METRRVVWSPGKPTEQLGAEGLGGGGRDRDLLCNLVCRGRALEEVMEEWGLRGGKRFLRGEQCFTRSSESPGRLWGGCSLEWVGRHPLLPTH